jgi:Flp pilus assembly pilin Flp
MPNAKDETGQTTIEYALMLAPIALVSVLSVFAVNEPFGVLASKIAQALSSVVPRT